MKSMLFIIWVVAITALSVMPYSKNGAASLKLTGSGMVVHFMAYFITLALFCWAYRKDTLFSILFSCFSIFMFGVVLEIVQFYLPYRAFNPVDIAANASGIFFFVICWAVFKGMKKKELGISKEEIGPQISQINAD
jgi:hypothetical protein